jgi:hypothetical protein
LAHVPIPAFRKCQNHAKQVLGSDEFCVALRFMVEGLGLMSSAWLCGFQSHGPRNFQASHLLNQLSLERIRGVHSIL